MKLLLAPGFYFPGNLNGRELRSAGHYAVYLERFAKMTQH
jgi:hypothetical protein